MNLSLPETMEQERRDELVRAETSRGKELIASGHVKRIWRVPGRWSNISLYDVRDATELHALLQSLPLWPWLDISAEALAQHPLEAAPVPPP